MLPVIAVGGVTACNLWKWRGVAVSSAILALIMVYSLQAQPSQSWFWTIALTLSIASTFVLTVLCSEEAHHALDLLSKDSTNHKQTLSLLNERLQLLQSKLAAEQAEFKLQRSQLQEQLAAKEEKLCSHEQLLKLARKEIASVLEKQEKLLQELFQVTEKNAVLEQRVVELQTFAKDKTVDDELQSKIISLNDENEQLNRSLREAQACAAAFQNQKIDLENVVRNKKELEKTVLILQEELEAVSLQGQEKTKQLEKLQNVLEAARADFEEAKSQHQELLEMVAVQKEAIIMLSEQEKSEPEDAHQIESLYNQLRQQFTEKTQVLSATRKELFLAQEKLSVCQIDGIESKIDAGRETIESLRHLSAEAEKEFALMEHQHAIEIEHLHEIIGSLTTKV